MHDCTCSYIFQFRNSCWDNSMKDLVHVYVHVSIAIINSRNEFIFFTIVGYLEQTPEILDSEKKNTIAWYIMQNILYISTADNSVKMGLLLRGTVLFVIGNFFAVFMNLLQINRQGDVSLKMSPELLENLFLKEWWVPPMCGAAAGNEYSWFHFHFWFIVHNGAATC